MNKVAAPNDRENESYLAKSYAKTPYMKGRVCQEKNACVCICFRFVEEMSSLKY